MHVAPRCRHPAARRENPDVFGEIDGWCVHPQRPPETDARCAQELTETGNEVQPSADVLSGGLDQDATIGVEEPPAVEDRECTDVLRPPLGFRPDEHEVCRGQTFNRRELTSRLVTRTPLRRSAIDGHQ